MKKKILMLVVLIISIFTVQVNAKQFYVKDNIKIDEDIVQYSNKNIETKVKMGETIGIKL